MSQRKTKIFKLTRQIKKLRNENRRLQKKVNEIPAPEVIKSPQDFKIIKQIGRIALILFNKKEKKNG